MIESAATRQLQRQGGRRTKATVSAEAGSSSGAAAAAAVASEAALVLHSSNRLLGGWMFGVSAAVFGMVAVGGYTRLTRSGLSMTDWRPQGRKLPSTDEEWDVEFDKYKVRVQRTPYACVHGLLLRPIPRLQMIKAMCGHADVACVPSAPPPLFFSPFFLLLFLLLLLLSFFFFFFFFGEHLFIYSLIFIS